MSNVPSITELRSRIAMLIETDRLVRLVFDVDKAMRKALPTGEYFKNWRTGHARLILKMSVLALGTYAGTPIPADMPVDAAMKRLVRAHLKTCAKLQAGQKKSIAAWLKKAKK